MHKDCFNSHQSESMFVAGRRAREASCARPTIFQAQALHHHTSHSDNQHSRILFLSSLTPRNLTSARTQRPSPSPRTIYFILCEARVNLSTFHQSVSQSVRLSSPPVCVCLRWSQVNCVCSSELTTEALPRKRGARGRRRGRNEKREDDLREFLGGRKRRGGRSR